MAGKKRRLKKIAKRKLRKEGLTATDSKRKDKENEEVKVPKIDNQTLQQLMMAQMMSSRARTSNGEGSGWISVQNQANADRIRQQQELNAMKAENKELKKQADDIEHNEKYKDMKDKYENERKELERTVVELKEKRAEAERLIPLKEEIEKLKREIADLEKQANDPVRKKEIEKQDLEAHIEYLRKAIEKGDPKDKETRDKIQEYEVAIKTLNERKERYNKLGKVKNDLEEKRSELKALFHKVKAGVDKLKDKQWNENNIDGLVTDVTHEITMTIDECNKQIEIMNENSNETKTLKQTKEARDMHLQNMMREHPLFKPVYEVHINELGENRTLADETNALRKAIYDYGGDLGLSMHYILEANAAINKNPDIRMTEDRLGEMMEREREKNPLYNEFLTKTAIDSKRRDDILNMIRMNMMGKYELSSEDNDKALMSIFKGEMPSFVEGQPIYPQWVNEFSAPLTYGADAVNEMTKNYVDEVSVAQFGPGTE